MKINMRNSSSVSINGDNVVGRSITIINGKVTVDGVDQSGELTDEIHVVVHGDVELLENNVGTVTAQNVGSIKTQAGDIQCGDVSGSAKTMSGDINCGSIGGGASTMSGDVRHR